jgi:hypothetical protein
MAGTVVPEDKLTTVSRAWRVAAAAVTIGVALPIICGDALVASHAITALARIASALA